MVSSLTDTLLGETIEGGGERRGTGFTEAVGSTAANIINRSLNGIVSQTIVNQFTGGKLNYASIVTDAFGNALGSSIAGEIRASLVANQQEGQLAAAQEVSALQRQQAMAAYGGSYGSNTSNGAAFQASIVAQDQEIQALFGVRNGVGLGAGTSSATAYPLRDSGEFPPATVGAWENAYSQPRPSDRLADARSVTTFETATGLDADHTPGLRAGALTTEAYANALEQVRTMPVKQIFNANDPHQYMIFVADDGTRNSANQTIPTNPRSLYQFARDSGNERVQSIYVTGVGTENDLGGLNSALGLGVPLQISQTLDRVAQRVNAIRESDPEAQFVFAMTGFSRGSAVVRQVQNALVEQGVPDLSSERQSFDSEGNSKIVYDRQLIAPKDVNIGASLIYDTVKTGIANLYPMTIPSQVQQTLHIAAANEYRDTFPLTSALNADGSASGNIMEMWLPGAHTNIGGGSYDRNGIGAANLELGYTYLQRVGVPLALLPESMRPDPSQFVIYDSRFRIPFVPNTPFLPLVNNPQVTRTTLYPHH